MTPPLLVDVSAVTDGLIAMLVAATGFAVGDDAAPDPAPGEQIPAMPYLVVSRIDGGGTADESWDDKTNPLQLVYQVDAVGTQRDEAEFAASVAYAALLTRQTGGAFLYPVTAPSGWKVYGRSLNTLGGAPHEGPLVTVAHRYNVWVCPA